MSVEANYLVLENNFLISYNLTDEKLKDYIKGLQEEVFLNITMYRYYVVDDRLCNMVRVEKEFIESFR